jgi:Tol biopolymer transport system component
MRIFRARASALSCSLVLLLGCSSRSTLENDEQSDDGAGAGTSGSDTSREPTAWLAYLARGDGDVGVTLALTRRDAMESITIDDSHEAILAGEWSPTGVFLALSASRGMEERGITVFRIDDQGAAEQHWLGSYSAIRRFSWSPDGRHLLEGSWSVEETLRIHDTRTWRDPVVVVSDAHIMDRAWSPLGHALSFTVVNDHEEHELYVAREDEAFAPKLVPLPEDVTRPEIDHGPGHNWSPDGRRLAFYARKQEVLDVPGTSRVFVTDDEARVPTLISPAHSSRPLASHAHWSPEGGRITYKDNNGSETQPRMRERYVVELADGAPSDATAITSTEAIYAWVSEHEMLAIEGHAADIVRASLLELDTLPQVTSVSLFTLPGPCYDVTLHSAARHVVLGCRPERLGPIHVTTWTPSDTTPTAVLDLESVWFYEHGWSPTGERLAFVGQDASGRGLYELDLIQGTSTKIAADVKRWSNDNFDRPEPWTPDGDAYFYLLDKGMVELSLGIRSLVSNTAREIGGAGLHVEPIGWQPGLTSAEG